MQWRFEVFRRGSMVITSLLSPRNLYNSPGAGSMASTISAFIRESRALLRPAGDHGWPGIDRDDTERPPRSRSQVSSRLESIPRLECRLMPGPVEPSPATPVLLSTPRPCLRHTAGTYLAGVATICGRSHTALPQDGAWASQLSGARTHMLKYHRWATKHT